VNEGCDRLETPGAGKAVRIPKFRLNQTAGISGRLNAPFALCDYHSINPYYRNPADVCNALRPARCDAEKKTYFLYI